MKHRLRWLATLTAMLLVFRAHAQLGPQSVEDFFRDADYGLITLSPDGSTMAALAPINGRANLVVMDVKTRKATALTNSADAEVFGYRWINRKRLLFWVTRKKQNDDQRVFHGGMYAVDIDGGRRRDMGRRSLLANVSSLPGGDPDSDEVIVQGSVGQVSRLNTVNERETTLVDFAPGPGARWILDRQGVARAVSTYDYQTLEWAAWHRADERSAWVKLESGKGFERIERRFSLVGFDYAGDLIVSGRSMGDRAALYYYDVEKKSLGTMLAEHPEVDVAGGLIFDRVKSKLVGLRVEARKREFLWVDDEWARWHAMINRALSGRVNELTRTPSGTAMTVYSYSDREPGIYYMFDPVAGTLEELIRTRPSIDASKMAERKPIRYRARDGLEIPAYLTLPPGKDPRKLPLVVVVHGGPFVRGEKWEWDGESQFLASRGYAVLQADFRGSTGYGFKHYQAGWKQWGRAMQDDLNDGVAHLAEQGLVDPNRACIMGASYGGYAAMMGVARDPEFWRCAISYAGVADLDLMVNIAYADYSGSRSHEPWSRIHVGNPGTDRELFEKSSPERLAHRIKRPVLLATGTDDWRVPMENGTRMRKAFVRFGVPHEWVLYDAEVHGFSRDAHKYDFYRRVEKFLEIHLKP